MACGKKLFLGAALSLVAFGVLAANTSGPAQAGPPEVQEVPGLRAAPHIPVRTLNGILPGHSPLQLPDRAAPLDRPPPPGGGGCDKDIDIDTAGQIRNARTVAAQDNNICSNADIDTYVRGTKTFVVQSAEEIAWTHTDVTDPANPVIVGQFKWAGRAGDATRTPDVKTFRQDGNDYIALSLERTKLTGACGVVIIKVEISGAQTMQSQFIGSDWCDTHNVFVEDDATSGDGAYIYATANATADLRVLDISNIGTVLKDPDDLGNFPGPVEVGTYRRTVRGFGGRGFLDDRYVHDVTVVGGTVYASYWLSGLDIFPATLIRTSGLVGQFANENTVGVQNIKPDDFLSGPPFLVHHAFPSSDGALVFVEDEITFAPGDEPVQMFNVTSGLYVDGLAVDDTSGDIPEIPAHNLETSGLTPDRLYVGWYKAGLQAWDFNGLGFLSNFFGILFEPRTAEVFHQAQTEANDDDYSGAWGVRLAEILATPEGGGPDVLSIFAFQSDRNFGLIVNCLGDGNGDLSGCPAALGGGTQTGEVEGFVTVSGTPDPIVGASVLADTGQNDITDETGFYSLDNVPTGTRTITASADGYVEEQDTNVTVSDGLTTSGVDFALVAEATDGGTGTIKGTVMVGGTRLEAALVETGSGQSDDTNKRGMYRLKDVPDGLGSVTASHDHCGSLTLYFDLPPGETITVDFTNTETESNALNCS